MKNLTKEQIQLIANKLSSEYRALHKEVLYSNDSYVIKKSEKLGRTIVEVKKLLADLAIELNK